MLNVTVYFVAGAEHPWFDLGVHVDPSNFILAGISAMADSSSSPAQHSSVTRDHETKGRELDLVQKLHHIPSPPTGDVSCCCGCRDCDFVKHTSEMLNTAAEVGQVCSHWISSAAFLDTTNLNHRPRSAFDHPAAPSLRSQRHVADVVPAGSASPARGLCGRGRRRSIENGCYHPDAGSREAHASDGEC